MLSDRQVERSDPGSAGAPTIAARPPEAPAPGSVTPALGYHRALDGLRGVAVLLVVVLHASDALWHDTSGWLVRGGALGVHLFFVLSGFLITTLLLVEHRRTGGIRLRAFAVRRVRRIAPVALALLAALFVTAATGTRLEVREVAETSAQVVTSTTNWWFAATVLRWTNGNETVVYDALHTWSLAVEVQFYVLLALGVWVATRRRWSDRRMTAAAVLLVAAIVVVRAAQAAGGTEWLAHYLMTWSRLDAPLAGAIVAIAFVGGRLQPPPRWLGPAGVAGLAVFVAGGLTVEWSDPALPRGLYTVLAVAGALTIAAVVSRPDGALARCLCWRPLAWIGVVSYSLYIWHYPLFGMLARTDPVPAGPGQFAGGIALAVVVAWLSYLAIERPFVRRRRRTTAPAPAVVPSP